MRNIKKNSSGGVSEENCENLLTKGRHNFNFCYNTYNY